MAIAFTPEQQQVIELRDRNILVSAAAGSGKTAVLVERIIGLICDEKNPAAAGFFVWAAREGRGWFGHHPQPGDCWNTGKMFQLCFLFRYTETHRQGGTRHAAHHWHCSESAGG